MLVDITVVSRKLNAFVDKNALDLLMFKETVWRLGLKVEKEMEWIKIMNSKRVPTMGVVKGVMLELGSWIGKKTIEVIPLEDYDFVVGLKFLDRINALLSPFFYYMCI